MPQLLKTQSLSAPTIEQHQPSLTSQSVHSRLGIGLRIDLLASDPFYFQIIIKTKLTPLPAIT